MTIRDATLGSVVRVVRAPDRGRALHVALGALVISERLELDPVGFEVRPA